MAVEDYVGGDVAGADAPFEDAFGGVAVQIAGVDVVACIAYEDFFA